MKGYEDALRRVDTLFAAGYHIETVFQCELAECLAYNNKLSIDKAALDARLTAGVQGACGTTAFMDPQRSGGSTVGPLSPA
jgi:hypothetical protein